MLRSRRAKVLSGGVLLLSMAVVWQMIGPCVTSDIPCYEFRPGELTYGLYLRVADNTGDLLLTSDVPRSPDQNSVQPNVYAYDPKRDELRAVDAELWKVATGKICGEHVIGCWGTLQADARISIVDGRLLHGDRVVETKGRTVLDLSLSPRGDVLAVITADGWKRPSIRGLYPLGGSWGGGYAGQHYVELFSLPSLDPRGAAIRIPLTSAEWLSHPRWSEDGSYLVLGDSLYLRICIIEVTER